MKKKAHRKVVLLKFFSYFPFPLSFGILTAFRYKDWFQISENTQSVVDTRVQIGFGFILAMIVFILVILKKVAYLKGIWGFVLALAITFCLRTIINELWLILLAITGAEIVYTILKSPLEQAEKEYELVKNTVIEEKVKTEITKDTHYSGRA